MHVITKECLKTNAVKFQAASKIMSMCVYIYIYACIRASYHVLASVRVQMSAYLRSSPSSAKSC